MVEAQYTPAHAYQDYFGPAIFEPLAQALFEHASPSPGDRVLDIACGTGIVTRLAASRTGPAGRVVGVDINPAMLDVARAESAPAGAPIEWRQGDAIALDLPDRAFDMVFCQQGLQFFPDRLAGVQEMWRVLAAGGRVALAVWQGLDRHPLYDALASAEVPHLAKLGADVSRDDVTAPFSLGDADDLHDLLTAAGFHAIEIVSRTIHARFPTADRFIERMEFAYAAVIPAFSANPEAFAAYLEAIGRETKPIVDQYRDGDQVVVPMHTHIAVALA